MVHAWDSAEAAGVVLYTFIRCRRFYSSPPLFRSFNCANDNFISSQSISTVWGRYECIQMSTCCALIVIFFSENSLNLQQFNLSGRWKNKNKISTNSIRQILLINWEQKRKPQHTNTNILSRHQRAYLKIQFTERNKLFATNFSNWSVTMQFCFLPSACTALNYVINRRWCSAFYSGHFSGFSVGPPKTWQPDIYRKWFGYMRSQTRRNNAYIRENCRTKRNLKKPQRLLKQLIVVGILFSYLVTVCVVLINHFGCFQHLRFFFQIQH